MSRILIDGREHLETSWDLVGSPGIFGGVRVMTTILSMGALLVDWDRHIERLRRHADQMKFGMVPGTDLLRFEVEGLIQNLAFPAMARVRIVIFQGDDGNTRRLVTADAEDVEVIQSLHEKGVTLSTARASVWERGSHLKTGIIGTRHAVLAKAKSTGFDDVLWLNNDGEIAEATWANIFLMGRTGDLVEIATPPVASGILEGVTRRRVMDLLNSAQIPVTERVITEEEIPRFDEAFMTSSIRGVVPVTLIGKHRLHSLRSNAVLKHIARLYKTWLKTNESNDSGKLDLN